MRTRTPSLVLGIVAFALWGGFLLFVKPEKAFAVNNLLFDATSKTVAVQGVLPVPVLIHTDSGVNVIGADVWIKYDPAFFDVQDTEDGTFFPTTQAQMSTTGMIYVAGLFDDVMSAKSGDGLITTINFVAKKTGTTELSYDCRGNEVSDTSKINVNFSDPQNVIDCSSTKNNILGVTVTEAGVATPTPTGGAGDATPTPGVYAPGGDTTLTPTPSVLPDSGFFDNTVYYVLSGGFMVGVGGILKKLYGQPF